MPPLNCEFQIPERVAYEGLDFAPKEARVFVSYIGRARVPETRVAPDLLKFVKERVELPRVKRVSELADEVGCPHQAGLRVSLGVILIIGDGEPRQFNRATDAIRVDERVLAETFAHGDLRALDMPGAEKRVGGAARR